MKKLLTSLVAASLLLTACSKTEATPSKQVETTTTVKELSKEEIVKKFYDNFSNAQSFNAENNTVFSDHELTMILKLKSPTIIGTQDISMQGYVNIPPIDGSEKMDGDISFIKKDDTTYINIPSLTQAGWIKTKNAEMTSSLAPFKGISEYFELKELFKDTNDNIKVSEENGKYKISYDKIDEKVYKIIADKLVALKVIDKSDATIPTNFSNSQGQVIFTVSKENFNVENLDFSLSLKEGSEHITIKSSSKITDINQVSQITLPEGAQYAIDAESLGA
ncbi:MAG: hypothetical protein Q3988_07565 [Gemella sp.]|nr:hypothetical protein [Gemella sp.]